MDSYENTHLKKAKYANKHFLEVLNTQLKFEIPKWMKKEWVTYQIAQKVIKVPATSLDPIRSNKTSGLIWMQTFWHSDFILKDIFWKSKNKIRKNS